MPPGARLAASRGRSRRLCRRTDQGPRLRVARRRARSTAALIAFRAECRKKQKTLSHCSYTVFARLAVTGQRQRRGGAMAAVESANTVPWWREPTKDQWYAYVAA